MQVMNASCSAVSFCLATHMHDVCTEEFAISSLMTTFLFYLRCNDYFFFLHNNLCSPLVTGPEMSWL